MVITDSLLLEAVLSLMFGSISFESAVIKEHFCKFVNIIAELRMVGVTAINDEQFLNAILLQSMPSKFGQAVVAITMSTKENLTAETVKLPSKPQSHTRRLESKQWHFVECHAG